MRAAWAGERMTGKWSSGETARTSPGGNLLLFGCDFFPEKRASEINFWNDLVTHLRSSFETIVVLSVNNRAVQHERIHDNVHLYNVRPHYPSPQGNLADPEYSGHRFHKLPLSALYKSFSVSQYLSTFDRLIRIHRIGVVHYMRVFGLWNHALVRNHPGVTFTITVPTHIDRGAPFHRLYHVFKNRGLRPMHRIVATSYATRQRLEKLRMDPTKISVIPWATDVTSHPVSRESASQTRREVGCPDEGNLVLWSGPLQDTGAEELRYSLKVAERVIEQSDEYAFIFAVKPGRLAGALPSTSRYAGRIRILETKPEVFARLQAISAAFLSPICCKNRTVAPPLTWIESMHRAVPVVTTPIPGVEELIENGRSGLIVDGVSETVRLFLDLDRERWAQLGKHAKQRVEEHYSLPDIARQYFTMWEKEMHLREVR